MAKSFRQPEPAAKLCMPDRVRFLSAVIDPSTGPRWFFANLVEVKLTQEATGGQKGVPHTYRVESSQPARWLAVCTPGDFGAFVLAASRPADRAGLPPPPGPPTEAEVAAITAIALEHGIELLGPPGALPGEAHAH